MALHSILYITTNCSNQPPYEFGYGYMQSKCTRYKGIDRTKALTEQVLSRYKGMTKGRGRSLCHTLSIEECVLYY